MKSGFDLNKVRNFRKLIKAGSKGPLRPVFKQWGIRYLAWTRRLFYIKSRGGTAEGITWPELSPVTIKRRRRRTRRVRGQSGGSRPAILVDRLGTIPKAMVPREAGNLFMYIKPGVRVGFGGPVKHPDGKTTIADIAVFHNVGGGRLPRRQILHIPNSDLLAKMRNDLRRGVDRIGMRT